MPVLVHGLEQGRLDVLDNGPSSLGRGMWDYEAVDVLRRLVWVKCLHGY